MAELRTDIIPDELLVPKPGIVVTHKTVFDGLVSGAQNPREMGLSKTHGRAKNITEFYDLVRLAIEDKEEKDHLGEDGKVTLVQDFTDRDRDLEAISIKIMRRQPGAFGEGPPFTASVKNLKPILRENVEDPANPGYRLAIFGYYYDNLVRFTCWARTNKEADRRALWFEDLMQDYDWFFRLRGVSRVLFWERGEDEYEDTSKPPAATTNKYYGRPIDYFVRTEKIRIVREKELEQLLIKVGIKTS